MWTSLKLIQWTADYFQKKEVPNPRLDAEILLAHALKCTRVDLYTQHEKKVGEKDLAKFKALVERRAKREPLQYIIGETEFYGLKIQVTPDVLIPRPETELLVEEALKTSPPTPLLSKERGAAERRSGEVSILDIGTGSACIAIALAKNLPEAAIVATEYSKEALETARENIGHHGLKDRIRLILSDIAPWKQFEAEGRQFDLIVSNPPYIPTDEFPTLQPEVRDFEPRKALDGGPEGLSIIRKILREAPDFIKSNGLLLMEIGENQAEILRREWTTYPSFKPLPFQKDYSGIERILRGQKD